VGNISGEEIIFLVHDTDHSAPSSF